MGLFQVMFQDRYFLFYTVFVLGQKAKKLSQDEEVSFLKSSWRESWKGISTEGRQSSSGRFIQGTHFSRKDWPQHPWPAGQAAFSLPGAIRCALEVCSTLKKQLKLIRSKSRWIPRFTRVLTVFIPGEAPRKGSDLCICLLVSICNLFVFIFVHAFYLVRCIEMWEIYWIKKYKDFYWLCI